MRNTTLIGQYKNYLPVESNMPVISLGEGNTPLIKLNNLLAAYQRSHSIHCYVKIEGSNPTGSFKDRGMTLAVSKAKAEGATAVLCASTGNTSASAAAFAARAGMQAFVIIPQGKIALGKLAQAMMHGAVVLQIQGNFDVGMQLVKELTNALPVTLVNSVNPYRLQGQKTVAFEIVDNLGSAPDYHYVPVGNAANISATWMGYEEYYKHQKTQKKPIMVGYQASGAAPFVRGNFINEPHTLASAICIGRPHSWDLAKEAIARSHGWFGEVSDAEILEAQYLLASKEGIFCEPASAASVAGFLKDIKRKVIEPGSSVVCTLTGHGLKDPNLAIEQAQNKNPIVPIGHDYNTIYNIIKNTLNN